MSRSKSLLQSCAFIALSLSLTACPIALGGDPLPETVKKSGTNNTSDSSDPDTVSTDLNLVKPSNIRLKLLAPALVEVSWDPVPGVSQFSITLNGNTVASSISSTSHIIAVANASQTYLVGVRTVNGKGQKSSETIAMFNLSQQLPGVTQITPQNPVVTAPTIAPTPGYFPVVVPTPEITPTPGPTYAPTAVPTAALVATIAPSATVAPLPTPTNDISVIEKTTFNGKIFDDTQSPLDGVAVKVKSLNSSVPFEAETVTAGGTFAFNNAPSGVQVEIVASKAGFTTRKRVEVLKSNKQGDPNANRYDFGTDGGASTYSYAYNALSDKPEVVMVTPTRNGSWVDPKTIFVLKFSEPMDKKTAEDTFTVRSFNSRKLTVDNGHVSRTNTVTGNGTIATNFLAGNSTQIWDKEAFNISWNNDDTEATFSFKEEKLLPTDKDSNLVPDYNVAFRSFSGGDRVLKDKSGISRNEKHFKLTDGDFEESYKFAIKTDEVKPTVTGITAETNENGGQNGDAVRVRFSERMIIYTRDIAIAGGMENIAGAAQKAPAGYPGGTIATAAATAQNYTITIQSGGVTTYNGTWAAVGGTAVYDTTDPTHKTVLLFPPTINTTANNVYIKNAVLSSSAGNFNTDAVNNFAYNFNLIRSTAGSIGTALSISVTLANLLLNNTSVAADLQAKLNLVANSVSPPPSNNPFTVTATADNKINLVFNDTSGNYLCFNITTNPTPTGMDVLPQFTLAGGTTLNANSKLDLYKPVDTVRVQVNSIVLDPAGNTLNSSLNNASANAT